MPALAALYRNPDACQSGNLVDFRDALSAWTRAKEALRVAMRREDFQAFVRPMYLLAVLGGHYLLLSLPPNRRVVERARNFRLNLTAHIRAEGYELAGFTAYPSDRELVALANCPSFQPFVHFIARGRLRKIERRVAAENARDRILL